MGAGIRHLLGDAWRLGRIVELGLSCVGTPSPPPDRKETWRENLVGRAPGRLTHSRLETPVRCRDQRRDAVGQLQVVRILDLHRLLSEMHVEIDHARHHVHALGVDDAIARRPVGGPPPLGRHRVEGCHGLDDVSATTMS